MAFSAVTGARAARAVARLRPLRKKHRRQDDRFADCLALDAGWRPVAEAELLRRLTHLRFHCGGRVYVLTSEGTRPLTHSDAWGVFAGAVIADAPVWMSASRSVIDAVATVVIAPTRCP